MKTNHTVRNRPWKRTDGGSIKGIWLLYGFTFVYAHFQLRCFPHAAFPEASVLINTNMISGWSTLCLKNRLGAVRSSSVRLYKLDTLNPLERRAESFLEVWTLLASNISNLVQWAEEHPHLFPISAGQCLSQQHLVLLTARCFIIVIILFAINRSILPYFITCCKGEGLA